MRRRSRSSRLESASRPKKQTDSKRKRRTRSNTRAIPRLVHTLHDGQRSHSSPRVEEKKGGLVEETKNSHGLVFSQAKFYCELSDDTR